MTTTSTTLPLPHPVAGGPGLRGRARRHHLFARGRRDDPPPSSLTLEWPWRSKTIRNFHYNRQNRDSGR